MTSYNKQEIYNKCINYISSLKYYELLLQKYNGLVLEYKARIDGTSNDNIGATSSSDGRRKAIQRMHRIDDYDEIKKHRDRIQASILWRCILLYFIKQENDIAYLYTIREHLNAKITKHDLSVKVSRYKNKQQDDYSNVITYAYLQTYRFKKKHTKAELECMNIHANEILRELYSLRRKDMNDLYKIK